MGKGDKKSEPQNTVVVGVRIRPPNPKEIAANMQAVFEPTDDNLGVQEILEDGEGKKWHYDHVFGNHCNNEFVFNTLAKPLVASALEGYNTVLFMYGQTSSGKTFTLFGSDDTRGLVDHSLEEVQRGVHAAEEQEFVIKMLFVELYNEELRDLLHDGESEPLKLGIIDDPVLGPLIHNITEKNFTTVEDMRRYLDEGDNRRQFGVTNMNAHSSRSHVMVRLNIESRKVAKKPTNPFRSSWGKDKPNCYSTLNLVDLAGSERANKSGTSGQSLKEGSFINKSLLTLGTVISNLSEGKSLKHIPYRNSKLTRLLSSALGGNAKTCMITCISPASGNIQESHSTLRFASRAKRIVNHAAKNELDDANSLKLKLGKQTDEIAELRARLEGGVFDGADELKEKASRARKNFQSLKFLVTSSSSVIKALNKESKFDLAKQVRDDVRGVLEGSRTLDDVIDSHKDIVDTHLAKDEKLTEKTRRFDRQITRVMEDEPDDEVSECRSEVSDVDMVEHFDSEDLLQECDGAHMYAEDVLARYIADEARLTAANKELNKTVKGLTQDVADVNEQLNASEGKVLALTNERNDLSKKLKKLMKKAGDDEAMIKEDLSNFEKQLNEMEGIISDRDKTIEQNECNLNAQSVELSKLNSDIDKLTKDLKEAIRMRQSFEDEAKRSKNELRGQVERLRGNMSNMLQQGDQESKVLQNQNQFLFNDLRQAQDEKDALQNSNTQMREEMTYLREELTKSQDEVKSLIKELQELRHQTSHDIEKVRFQALEMDKKNKKIKMMQKEFDEVKEQLSDENEQLTREVTKLTEAHKEAESALSKQIRELKGDLSVNQIQLESEQSAREAKDVETQRVESKFSFETKKLEKKIADQVKEMEAVQKHAEHAAVRNKYKIQEQRDEITKHKMKIQELEQTLESVESFISNEVNNGGHSNYDDYEDESTLQSDVMSDPGDDDNDYNDDENSSYYGNYTHRESWDSVRSNSPTTAAITKNGSTSAGSSKLLSSKHHMDSSARLAAIFSTERSSKAKALVLAVKTVSASLKCIAEGELNYVSGVQQEVLITRDKYSALVHDHQRISQEVETLQHLNHRSSESLEEFYFREDGMYYAI